MGGAASVYWPSALPEVTAVPATAPIASEYSTVASETGTLAAPSMRVSCTPEAGAA